MSVAKGSLGASLFKFYLANKCVISLSGKVADLKEVQEVRSANGSWNWLPAMTMSQELSNTLNG